MKRRILATILTFACIASFVGCGKENVDTNIEPTLEEVSVEESTNAEVVENVKDVVETVVESIVEEVKEPEMIIGKTKDSEGRTLMSMGYVNPWYIDEDDKYDGFTGVHCRRYTWCFKNEDGSYALKEGTYIYDVVYTFEEIEPCEYPDKEDWTYHEFDGVTLPDDKCFECTKCSIIDEGSLDYHLGKAFNEAGNTHDSVIFTKRSQEWIETRLAPVAKDTYIIRD